jgi:hypothetical protein
MCPSKDDRPEPEPDHLESLARMLREIAEQLDDSIAKKPPKDGKATKPS